MVRLSLGPRGQAVLVLALVATIGALIGVLADRFIAQRRTADTPAGMERMAPAPRGAMMSGLRYGDGLAARLDLTTEQREQIETILAQDRVRARELTEQFQPQFRALAGQTRQRVEAVLTPEQREQLRAMRQQRMRRPREMRPGGMQPGDMDGARQPRRPGTSDTTAATGAVRQP